jgi:hypothetical protein
MKNPLSKFIATSILACLVTITLIVILIAGKHSITREHVITEDGVTWYTTDEQQDDVHFEIDSIKTVNQLLDSLNEVPVTPFLV